ncbi:4'-phosphopantetheinyl transferase superfamily protein [Methylomonas sp. AM2-LC]|uniref:4'-phosphopantetheinyl transferase family protein n=1 Tax=Methylomonas sp. AM2-LC TaxID=3153301 RepID=UPI003266FD26
MPVVDIWQGELIADNDLIAVYTAMLDQQELTRAAGFKSALLRNRFILVRGLLRTTLASYLAVEPASLHFAKAKYGKPILCDHALYFNLSHSANKLVIAVSDLENIGIDIEQIKPRNALHEIARRVLSVMEFTVWSSLHISEQLVVFYQLWTKKEAFVKAVGRGMGIGLDQCEVDMLANLRFVNIPCQYGHAQDWNIIEFAVDVGFSAALVVPNVQLEVRAIRLDNNF